MKTAIATVCLSGVLDEKLEAIAQAGFSGVEIFENDLLSFHGAPADIRRMAGDLGLEIVTYQPFRDFEGMPPHRRAKVFDRAERKFDLLDALGCDLLMICSNVSPDCLGGIDRAAEDLRELGERAAARGLRIGFEALAWGRHVNDYRDAWEVVRRADRPNVGLVLDSFHTLVRRTDLAPMRAIPADRIFLVQMADAPWLEQGYLPWSRHHRSFPGQGELPIRAFMEALLATGFDGLLSLEIFNDQFRAGSARSVALDGRRALIALRDETRAAARHAPPPMPPKAVCSGVEFLEFAIDEGSAPAFEALLASLGFAKVGRHVSKAVTRWRQGEINLVVNCERDGFAFSYNLLHGSSVCAIGLRVDDAAATLRRAEALLDTPFAQAVAPGELSVPAVSGLGGSLLYFVDRKSALARIWEVEFLPPQGSENAGSDAGRSAGLRAVDHVSQSLDYEDMLSWILFYTSLLDLEKLPLADVLDPGGVLKSQVLRNRDGALQMVLNASQSARTRSARFMDDLLGAGVQHVAFACDDLLATAERLRAAGVELLEPPANYYVDLAAKTELSEAEIAALRARRLFYEEDADGAFLHGYTEPFEDRFFFELVERRGRYAGLGASNAQVRLTAQALRARERGFLHLTEDDA